MSLIKKIYICLFAVLYLCVAFTSTLHAIEFFGLANAPWLAVILAISFELGQAAVLFELLTSKKDRTKIMPWVLMTIFTLVQVLGNVYSSYKYILLNSPENLRYFKEPIFIWTQLPDEQATVIVTYIVGAILPICALLLTSMITNQLEDSTEQKTDIEKEEKEVVYSDEKTSLESAQVTPEHIELPNNINPLEEENNDEISVKNDEISELEKEYNIEEEKTEEDEQVETIFEDQHKEKSRFINLK